MNAVPYPPFRSHGDGSFSRDRFRALGDPVVFEAGVLVFHPETIRVGSGVYVGHRAMLKGHPRGEMLIGDGCWIGQNAFLHSAGGLTIGTNVGIGPNVSILTSQHGEDGRSVPILRSTLHFAPVVIGDDADIGLGAVVLPGVTIGRGAQIGAGAVVATDIPKYAVAVGVPARVLRLRAEPPPP